MNLSLCLIVKNEEKNLISNLGTLKEYLERGCELIIVDTGSSDNTIKVSKNFTDKIYKHQWKNDFSEARNFSISQASNDWVFILDADEVLKSKYENIEKIMKFCQERKIDGIEVIIRNFLPGGSFNIDKQIRIFNRKKAVYRNNIHNQLSFFGKPKIIKSNIVIDHFGYSNITKVSEKRRRTISMIKEHLKENPENPYMIQQLARAYFAINDYENSFKYANIISQKIFNKELKVKPKGLFFLESLVIAGKSLFETDKSEKSERYYSLALKIFPKYLDALLLSAELNYSTGKKKDAEEKLIKYICLHDEILKNINQIKLPPTNTFGMKLNAFRFLIVILKESERIKNFKPYVKEYLSIEKNAIRKKDLLQLLNL
jgi:glycosyltransferase involved in cell wall biosynthesis